MLLKTKLTKAEMRSFAKHQKGRALLGKFFREGYDGKINHKTLTPRQKLKIK